MCKICVFAGTAEGRELIGFLLGQRQAQVTACVATEYGKTLLPDAPGLSVSCQRLDREEMAAMLAQSRFDLVIDATHPYAVEATENIAAACRDTGTDYLRLCRDTGSVPEDAAVVPNAAAAVQFLEGTRGNILLTTGSKDLAVYAGLSDFGERVYARVLPAEDSLRLCREAGLPASHVLAMQGPFSQEMNLAALRFANARYLVTKAAGSAGGFEEKLEAAAKAGAVLVVIGPPPQQEGLSLPEMIEFLSRRYAFSQKQQVQLVGIGPGDPGMMTRQALESVEQADCVIGAARMVQAVSRPGQATFCAIRPEEIRDDLLAHPQYRRFAVVFSGDIGFFSGAKKLLPLLEGFEVRLIPGISSLSYFCARLGVSYEDVVPVSLHGRTRDIVPDVLAHPRVFVLVGGEDGISRLCQALVEGGLEDVRVSVGERLGYPDEKITDGTAAQLAGRRFDRLSVALIENSGAQVVVTHGIPDEAFLRGGEKTPVPMTKSEVRSVSLSKLRLTADAVCWDVGAGTGSVAVEMALQARRGQVFAIEQKEEAVLLLKENRRRFGVQNLEVVEGRAPQICRDLPAPTHAFIGGSSGNMRQIFALLIEKNPRVRIVATAVTLESAAELTRCMTDFGFEKTEVVSLSVARARPAGNYHLMTGQNPVYIFTMQGGRRV